MFFRNFFVFPWALRFSLAYGFGTGILGLLLFYASYLGFQLNKLTILFIAFLFLPFFFIRLFKRKKNNVLSAKLRNGVYEYLFLFFITISLAIVFFKALCLPMHLPDDRGQWGLQAKKIYLAESIYAEDFFNVEITQLHIGYPLLIPLIETSFYCFFGKLDDIYVKLPFPFFFLCIILFFYSAQRKFASHRHALFFTAMLAVLPPFIQDVNGGPSSGYADIPFTFYYTVSGISVFYWLKNNKTRDLLLGILFISFAMFTKQEGMIVWAGIILGVICFLAADKTGERKQRAKRFLGFAFIPLLLILPWLQYKRTLAMNDYENDWNLSLFTLQHINSHLYRILPILKSMRDNFLTPEFWNVTWILFGLTIILYYRKTIKFPQLFLLIIVGINLLAVFSAVFLYPWPWWENFIYDMFRVIMMNIPLTLFFVSFQLAQEKEFLNFTKDKLQKIE
jgi:hypothetical protein